MEEPTHEIERIEPSTSVFVFFGNCHTISDWGNNGEVSAKIRALDSPAAPVNFKQTLTVAITSEVHAAIFTSFHDHVPKKMRVCAYGLSMDG